MRIGSYPHRVSIKVIPSISKEYEKRQDGMSDDDSLSSTIEDRSTTNSDEEPN